MVKSFAHKAEGGWLNEQLQAALQNAAHDFNGASDPLYARRVEDQHKSEAERRSGQVGDNGNKNPSKPAPVLKPKSQRGRVSHATPTPQGLSSPSQTQALPSTSPQAVPTSQQQETHMSFNQNNAWLAAHYWRAMSKAKPETSQARSEHLTERKNDPGHSQENVPNNTPPHSPSQ